VPNGYQAKSVGGWRILPPVAVCDPEGTCTLRLIEIEITRNADTELRFRDVSAACAELSPVFDGEIDAGFLNGGEIVGIAGYEGSVQPHGDSSN